MFILKIFDHERENLILWVPVLFAIGILIYFAFPYEPSLKLSLSLFTSVLALLVIARIRPDLSIFIISVCIVVSGFLVIKIRTHNLSYTKLLKEINYVKVVGKIESITPLTNGYRVVISEPVFVDYSQELCPKKIRLTVRTKLGNSDIGDFVMVKANLLPLPTAVIPGGYDFSTYAYYEEIGAIGYSVSDFTPLTSLNNLIKNDQSMNIYQHMLMLRRNISEHIVSILGKRTGPIAAALMIGEFHAIDKKILENMRIAGISHILSVSGMHISMVAAIFFFTVRLLLTNFHNVFWRYNIKKIAAIIAIIGSYSYLLISGMQIAAIRSFIMTSMLIGAIVIDRTATPMRSIAFAALIILIIWPESILNPSFQMSFSAVIALIASYNLYNSYSTNLISDKPNLFRTITNYTIATIGSSFIAGIATAPFTIYHFNQYSVFSILANLIAVPITSFIIMPAVIVSFLFYPFAIDNIPLKIMGYGIEAIISISQLISSWPNAVRYVPAMPHEILLFITFGGLWLSLWKTKIKMIGIIFIIIAFILFVRVQTPHIIISNNKGIFTLLDKQNKLVFSCNRVGGFVKDNWLHANGQASDEFKSSLSKEFDCKDNNCQYQVNGFNVIITYYKRNDKCYSFEKLQIKHGSSHVYQLSKEDINKNGAHSISIKKEGLEIRNAKGFKTIDVN